MRIYSFIIVILLISTVALTQAPDSLWSRTYGISETAGYREGSLRNYVSAVWREVPRLGRLECREELTVSAREYDVSGDITRTISNNIRGDWKPFREMFFRAEWRVTYQVDEVDSEVTHRVEVRMGVRL